MPLFAVTVEKTTLQTTVVEVEADNEEEAEDIVTKAANAHLRGTSTEFRWNWEWDLGSEDIEVTSVEEE